MICRRSGSELNSNKLIVMRPGDSTTDVAGRDDFRQRSGLQFRLHALAVFCQTLQIRRANCYVISIGSGAWFIGKIDWSLVSRSSLQQESISWFGSRDRILQVISGRQRNLISLTANLRNVSRAITEHQRYTQGGREYKQLENVISSNLVRVI